jgi:hypothetical protein
VNSTSVFVITFALIIVHGLRDLPTKSNYGDREGQSAIAKAKMRPPVGRKRERLLRSAFQVGCRFEVHCVPRVSDCRLSFLRRSDIFFEGQDERGKLPTKRPLVNVIHQLLEILAQMLPVPRLLMPFPSPGILHGFHQSSGVSAWLLSDPHGLERE